MTQRITEKFLDFKPRAFVGISRPTGGGYSSVDGKRCKGTVIGLALAYHDGTIWRVTNG